MTELSAHGPHRVLFRAAVAAALAVTAVGVVLVARGSATPSGPTAVVTQYFAALQRGDAATALALGHRPGGDTRFLTVPVLRTQQRVAPITELAVGRATQRGSHAAVNVSYSLAYPDGIRHQRVTVRLRRRAGAWRMLRVAGTTRLVVTPASRRATVLGAAVPNGAVALFPGAVPVRLDTPYLEVSSRSDAVGLRSGAVTVARIVASSAGRLAASLALQRMVATCLASGGAACPLPGGRVVPGSVRGRQGGPLEALRVRLVHSPSGIVSVRARLAADVRFRQLTFRNDVMTRRRRVTLQVHTIGYVTAPLQLRWRAS